MKHLTAVDTYMQKIFSYLDGVEPDNPIISILKAASIATDFAYKYRATEFGDHYEANFSFDRRDYDLMKLDFPTLVEKFCNDSDFRFKIEKQACNDNLFAELVLLTSTSQQPENDGFWNKIVSKILTDYNYRTYIERCAKNGEKFSEKVILTATIICRNHLINHSL